MPASTYSCRATSLRESHFHGERNRPKTRLIGPKGYRRAGNERRFGVRSLCLFDCLGKCGRVIIGVVGGKSRIDEMVEENLEREAG